MAKGSQQHVFLLHVHVIAINSKNTYFSKEYLISSGWGVVNKHGLWSLSPFPHRTHTWVIMMATHLFKMRYYHVMESPNRTRPSPRQATVQLYIDHYWQGRPSVSWATPSQDSLSLTGLVKEWTVSNSMLTNLFFNLGTNIYTQRWKKEKKVEKPSVEWLRIL